jgi:hypothetical protein
MSNQDQVTNADQDGDRLVRAIGYAGFVALPLLALFVHLLVIYRS